MATVESLPPLRTSSPFNCPSTAQVVMEREMLQLGYPPNLQLYSVTVDVGGHGQPRATVASLGPGPWMVRLYARRPVCMRGQQQQKDIVVLPSQM
jgi:hypothetical protein